MLRALTKSDLEQVIAIEEAVQVTPWTEETFYTCLDAGYSGWVVDLKSQIVGFIIVAYRRTECHILNLCVLKPYQHRGYGQQLLSEVLKDASQKGVTIAYLEVRRSNVKAIALYRKMRFYLVGQRRDYYPAPVGKEDALIFAKDLQVKVL